MGGAGKHARTMVTHTLRYDDFSASSCTAVEESLVDLLLTHRMPCTFAVVPYACDPQSILTGHQVNLTPLPASKAQMLRPLLKAGLAEVALHGYSHLALAPVRGLEEFSERMPQEVQRTLITRGRDHLEDIFGEKIRVYVPPWNRLAPSTATILVEEGFVLSGGMLEIPYACTIGLPQLPCTNSAMETARALATANRFGHGNNCVGTFMHDYDFRESHFPFAKISLQQFEGILLDWKNAGQSQPELISAAIIGQGEVGKQRATANLDLRKRVTGGRLRRRIGAPLLQVYWDLTTANFLNNLLGCVP